ncbi:hypothetical protein KUCAC02_010594, partial [Chaenocephalus aceratus]
APQETSLIPEDMVSTKTYFKLHHGEILDEAACRGTPPPALHSLLNSSDPPPPSTPPLDITNPISSPSLPLPQRPHRLPSVPPRLPNTLTLPSNIPCHLSLSFPHRPPYYRPLLVLVAKMPPHPPQDGLGPALLPFYYPFRSNPSTNQWTGPSLSQPTCLSTHSGTAHHHYPATVTPSPNYCSGGPSTSSHLSLTWPASSSTYNNHPPDKHTSPIPSVSQVILSIGINNCLRTQHNPNYQQGPPPSPEDHLNPIPACPN